MKRFFKYALITLFCIGVLIWMLLLARGGDISVLNPQGMIAEKQKDLIMIATLLMLIVVIPVFILAGFVIWRYREGNRKAKYSPDWAHSYLAEWIWWGIPCLIMGILGWITWKSCQELDPFKPLEMEKKPVVIQVVALQWKWLFIYPEQGIASVNFMQIPEHTPVNFEITADAPMNSFWIPSLGGQIYAMPGMRTKLHLIANEKGRFRGCSANLSGEGFAGMTFVAQAGSEEEFREWVESVRNSSDPLTLEIYRSLVEPSQNHPVVAYVLAEDKLFDHIMMSYEK